MRRPSQPPASKRKLFGARLAEPAASDACIEPYGPLWTPMACTAMTWNLLGLLTLTAWTHMGPYGLDLLATNTNRKFNTVCGPRAGTVVTMSIYHYYLRCKNKRQQLQKTQRHAHTLTKHAHNRYIPLSTSFSTVSQYICTNAC